MSQISSAAIFVLGAAFPLALWASDPAALSTEARRERIKGIRVMMESLAGKVGEAERRPLTLLAEPSLLYADNERELSDASLWVWEDRGRLAALSAIELRPREGTGGVWSFECASLTNDKLTMKLPTGEWSVATGLVPPRPISAAPPPAKVRGQRLLQVRKLADRFSAMCYSRTQGKIELRRLAAPVYRQTEAVPGDAALFVFANGTNPEVVLLLQSDPSAAQWTYTVASLSGDEASAQLDEQEIWRVERFTGPGTRTTYTNGKLKTEPLR